MMRQLTEQDRTQLLDYLYPEANYNIFIIGDIEHFGFDQPFQQVYGTFDHQGLLSSVFLRYRQNGVFYTTSNHPIDGYLPIIAQDQLEYVSIKGDLAAPIQAVLPDVEMRTMYFCTYRIAEHPTPPPQENIQTVNTKKDIEQRYDLLKGITEFSIHKQTKEEYVEAGMLSMKMGEHVAIEEDGIMVATASTTAETSVNAIVVGVATHPDYRNKGLASKVMIELQRRYHKKQKDLCLFYDNPRAGSIYHRIGFVDKGTWVMFVRKS